MLTKIRAGFGIAVAQLRYYRVRTVLVILAITLAVLSTTLFASVGVGVMESGVEKFDTAGRDLWITGGPIRFTPGGIENAIVEAHSIAREIRTHEDVLKAEPIGYQTVYIGTDPSDLQPILGAGITGGGGGTVTISEGRSLLSNDSHYADGEYDGPMTYEVVVGPRVKTRYNLSIGDSLYIGGTISSAQDHRFTVVGVSPTFSRFLGTRTVFLLLSELQEVSGTTGSDRAAHISVVLTEDADSREVANDLQARYPEYEIRSNREQLAAVLQDQAAVIASGFVLVVLAVVAGIALSVNVLSLLVHHQRREFAGLKAGGVSSWTLGWVIVWQALLIAGLGIIFGLILTPIAATGLNFVAESLVGFEGLVRTPLWVYLTGAGIALVIGVLGGVIAAWRITSIRPLSVLQ